MTTVAYLAVSPRAGPTSGASARPEVPRSGLRRLTETVHDAGAAAAAQIGHAGPVANARSNGCTGLAPSNGFSPMGTRLRAPPTTDIDRITEDYRRGPAWSSRPGFDCIEIHLGHNYLLSAFLSPKLNRRTDGFGGSLENRARFPAQVVEVVRRPSGTGWR
jgi:2,4-dienoyl-CoA reductase-like NADH-dependent reductase (Old Yellow Enzyme family)